jgi:aspartate/methionine/tyrosine aminotransferase
MQLPIAHSTSIDNLLSKGSNSIFLSDWSKQDGVHLIERSLITKAFHEAEKSVDEYHFIDETYDLKLWLSGVFNGVSSCLVTPGNFAISSNGTISIFLILHILKKFHSLNVLLLSPIYFSYINLLNDLSAKIQYLQIVHDGKIVFDFDALEHVVVSNQINLIILNDPLFGVGISFGEENYEMVASLCEEHQVNLLVDYIYGGMEWENHPSIVNGFLVDMVLNHDKVILVESISKRIFLNGAKTSLVFAHPKFIKEFEHKSVHTIGTLASAQISMMREIYDPANKESLLSAIQGNIKIARDNYSLLTTLLMGTNFCLSYCNSGYFCLLCIPLTAFDGGIDGSAIAEELIKNFNILTIPHDRYLYFSESKYCFRLNLSIPSSTLLVSISKLLNAMP